MEIVRVENLSKTYGKGAAEVKALDDISFVMNRGDFVAVVGTSGSGKSTLLHLLGGVDQPTKGNVFIEGTDIYRLNKTRLAIFRRRQVGLVYQFYNLVPILTVKENILLPLLLDGREVVDGQLQDLLRVLDLTKQADRLPQELSGGQQQRVAIGRSLINRPALLLADEPTGNLDSHNSQEIIALLRWSNANYDQSLIVVTHNLDIALQADRIVTLTDGKITADEVVRP